MKNAGSPFLTRFNPFLDLPQHSTTGQIKEWCVARADEWYRRGDMVPARDFLRHAVDIDPQDAEVWVALGSIHFALGELAPAKEAFTRADRLDPANPTIYLHLGVTQQQLGNETEAEVLYDEALQLQPENVTGLKLLSGFLMARGRLAEARTRLEAALGCDLDDTELLMRLGVCCFWMKDVGAARACFQRVLRIDPVHEMARENLAVIIARSRTQK